MKLLAALALSGLALCVPLRAGTIWSYVFTEQYADTGPLLGFEIWHNGPIIANGGIYLESGDELASLFLRD